MAEAGMGDVDRLTWGGANIGKDHGIGDAPPRPCAKCAKNDGTTVIGGRVYCQACAQTMRMAEYMKDPDE